MDFPFGSVPHAATSKIYLTPEGTRYQTGNLFPASFLQAATSKLPDIRAPRSLPFLTFEKLHVEGVRDRVLQNLESALADINSDARDKARGEKAAPGDSAIGCPAMAGHPICGDGHSDSDDEGARPAALGRRHSETGDGDAAQLRRASDGKPIPPQQTRADRARRSKKICPQGRSGSRKAKQGKKKKAK